MRIRLLSFAAITLLGFSTTLTGGEEKKTKSNSAIQIKNGDRWVDTTYEAMATKLRNDVDCEVQLRGWLSRLTSTLDKRNPIWMIDVGETTWVLDIRDNVKLGKTAGRLNHQQVIVRGPAVSESLGASGERLVLGVTAKSLERFESAEQSQYVTELEAQVKRLYQRLDAISQANEDRELSIELPPARNAKPLVDKKPIVITVAKDGKIVFEKKSVTLDQLESVLGRKVKDDPNQSILIRSDRGVPFRQINEVLSVCSKVGLRDVSVAVSSPE